MRKTIKKITTSITALLALLVSGGAGAACNADVTITKPDSIYTNHDNGTVTDNQTGLMWMQCSQGLTGVGCTTGTATSYVWDSALAVVQAANSGAGTFGYTDWRLPDRNELGSLVELACYDPSINVTFFPVTVSSYYWSSSPFTNIINYARIVPFNGNHGNADIKDSNHYVRLVRGGY